MRMHNAVIGGMLALGGLFIAGCTKHDGGPVDASSTNVNQMQQIQTQAVIDAVKALPGRAVIVSGWVLPRIALALGGDRLSRHQFIYLVENEGDYRHYLAEGWEVYYLPGVDLYESQVHQLELAEMGARALNVPRERQRPQSSGE